MFIFGLIVFLLNSLAFLISLQKGTFDLGLFISNIFIALALTIGI